MSTKSEVPIEQYEVDKVLEGISRGGVIVVKQGIINPSFVVGIVPDVDRRKSWIEETRYGLGQGDEARERGMEPLRNIFERTGTKVEKLLAENEAKMLGSGAKQLPENK